MQINMHAAKTKLSQLVERAEQGEEVILARDGQPVARIVSLSPLRKFETLQGIVAVPDWEQFRALTEEEASEWY